MDKFITGKRVILFDFEANELTHFVKLHREDKQGLMGKFCLREMTQEEGESYVSALILSGQIKIWSCYTKEGRASKKIGYLYLSDISSFSARLVGIIDKDVLRGLLKVIRRGKYSFSEDAIRTLINWCFSISGLSRIEYWVFTDNKLSLRLAEKSGFIREGILRQSFIVGDKFKDMAVYAVLKEIDKTPVVTGKDTLTKD